MRNAVLVMTILILMGMDALAQVGSPWAEKVFPDGFTHDFGSTPRGNKLYYKFKMYNLFDVPLEILVRAPQCNCVSATASVKKLDKNEEGYIEIVMETGRFTGAKTVTIPVTVTNPKYTSTAELKVSANSRSDVVFNPPDLNFGVVARGQSPSQTVDVEYAGNLPWRVLELIKNDAPLDVAFEEWYRKPGQVGYRVKATLKSDAPAGSHKWELFLKTNDPASPLVSVLVEATIQAPLTVLPDPLKLGTIKVGAEVLGRAIIRSSGKPFRILSIEGLGDGLLAADPSSLPSKEAMNQQMVLFKCQPPKAGELRRVLQIKTDIQDAPVALTIEANVNP